MEYISSTFRSIVTLLRGQKRKAEADDVEDVDDSREQFAKRLRSNLDQLGRTHHHDPIQLEHYSAVDRLITTTLASLSDDTIDWDEAISNVVQSIEVPSENDGFAQHQRRGGDNEEDEDAQPSRSERHLEMLNFVTQGLDIRGKYKQQLAQCEEMARLGWADDTILAYLKLSRRGFEPLFSADWTMHFPGFPLILFEKPGQQPFISVLKESNVGPHSTMFDRFCRTGYEVRAADAYHTGPGRRPEARIEQSIEGYLRWIWKDSDLHHDLAANRVPLLFTVVVPSWKERRTMDCTMIPQHLEKKAKANLSRLAGNLLDTLEFSAPESKDTQPHGQYLIEPPTLFGFVICDTNVSVVAHEPLTKEVRMIGLYDFNNQQEESWNAISLAIVIHWVRYSMLRIKAALERGSVSPSEDEEPSGPPTAVSDWRTNEATPRRKPFKQVGVRIPGVRRDMYDEEEDL